MNKQCHLCRDVPGLLRFCRTGILELKLCEGSLLAAMTCLDQNVTGNWLPQPWHRRCRLGTQQPCRLPAFLQEVLAMPVSVGCRAKPFPSGCLKELGNTKRPRTNGTRSHPKDRVPRVLPAPGWLRPPRVPTFPSLAGSQPSPATRQLLAVTKRPWSVVILKKNVLFLGGRAPSRNQLV